MAFIKVPSKKSRRYIGQFQANPQTGIAQPVVLETDFLDFCETTLLLGLSGGDEKGKAKRAILRRNNRFLDSINEANESGEMVAEIEQSMLDEVVKFLDNFDFETASGMAFERVGFFDAFDHPYENKADAISTVDVIESSDEEKPAPVASA